MNVNAYRSTTLGPGVLVLLALLSGGSVCYGDEAEDRAVGFVKRLGGDVGRDASDGKPVFRVTLDDSDFADKDVKELAAFKKLRILQLAHTKLTDVGLKQLPVFEELSDLDLRKTQIADAAVKSLTALKALENLDLSETN